MTFRQLTGDPFELLVLQNGLAWMTNTPRLMRWIGIPWGIPAGLVFVVGSTVAESDMAEIG